jgi:hypothetical protein
MWDLLKKTDIEQAKQGLKLRRAEALRRHAEESQNLDADRVQLETLNVLVDIFVQKHRKPAIVSHAPIAPPISPQPISTHPISTQNSGGKAPAEPRHRRHLGQTVYASYMRAASRV